jgi:hypothetical protein
VPVNQAGLPCEYCINSRSTEFPNGIIKKGTKKNDISAKDSRDWVGNDEITRVQDVRADSSYVGFLFPVWIADFRACMKESFSKGSSIDR